MVVCVRVRVCVLLLFTNPTLSPRLPTNSQQTRLATRMAPIMCRSWAISWTLIVPGTWSIPSLMTIGGTGKTTGGVTVFPWPSKVHLGNDVSMMSTNDGGGGGSDSDQQQPTYRVRCGWKQRKGVSCSSSTYTNKYKNRSTYGRRKRNQSNTELRNQSRDNLQESRAWVQSIIRARRKTEDSPAQYAR